MSQKEPWFRVIDNQKTLEYIIENQSSVARFGDGEFDIISGSGIPYQDHSEKLAKQMRTLLARQSNPELVVCIPDVFENLERYNQFSRDFWHRHLEHKGDVYRKYCTADWYGSTFISRPYIDLEDKSSAKATFALLKKLWQGRDLLIVEGATTRSGIGNDLFENANSIERIICPSRNAYAKLTEIEEAIRKYGQDKLILLMLGPTAKVIVSDLQPEGLQLIDLGHVDSEYEWFKMGATTKVKLEGKHTAEFNYDNDPLFSDDEQYLSQIVMNLTDEAHMSQKVSIIVLVQNDEAFLEQTLENLTQQSYKNLEIILVNNASTDRSSLICEAWAKKDARVKVFHEKHDTLGKLRNVGLAHVTGEYFIFAEPGNWLEQEAIAKLVEAFEQNPAIDIAVSNYVVFEAETGRYLFNVEIDDSFEREYSLSEWIKFKNSEKISMSQLYQILAGKLFRTKALKQIRFPEDETKQGEFFVYRFYLASAKIYFVNSGLVIIRAPLVSETLKIAWQEEYVALLISRGLEYSQEQLGYNNLLSKKRDEALLQGDISSYQELEQKIALCRLENKD